jgi:hypothetical protein
MNNRITAIRSHIPAGQSRLSGFNPDERHALDQIGIGMSEDDLATIRDLRATKYGMDTVVSPTTAPSMFALTQFLQTWLPGLVYILTAARNIDDFVGVTMAGSWEDVQVVQQVLERIGNPRIYDDYNNVPLASYNNSFNYRSVIRFELGFIIGRLEEAQAARMGVPADMAKRQAVALALDIVRNNIGFNGFNNGANNIYGFLNDPNLPAYVTVPAGGGGSTLWSDKTYLEIIRDINAAVAQLQTQSQGIIDPRKVDLVLALPTNSVAYLGTVSDFSTSVQDWITKTYPRMRVVSAPQLDGANGGDNVFYLYADRVPDDVSTDNGRTFEQIVQTKFQLLGVQQLAKGYEEDYSNAMAGIMLKRPFAVVRYSGI